MSDEDELQKEIKLFPPPLEEKKHKGQAGRIGIIGGSREYTGAPYFAGITALKCGADLIYIFCTKDAAIPIKSYSPELIVLPFLDDEHGRSLTITRLMNLHSLVIGPGLGENVRVHSLIVSVIQHIKENKNLSNISLVFDADGISLLTNNKEILRDYPGSVYLTPNANEIKKLAFAYLGRRDINVEEDNGLKNLVAKISHNTVMILKGVIDKIVTSNGVYCCSAQGCYRRIGGQGDLLSGSLGLFAYWANLYKEKENTSTRFPVEAIAGYSACFLIRLCSKLAFDEKSRGMITSDMITQINKAYNSAFL